jgi:MFS family permease
MQKIKHSPRLYYGWYIAVALAITETISWGIIYYAFTVFILPMEKDLGWSKAQLTGGFSLSLLVAGGLAYPVGAWIDRHGARFLMTVGSILASLLIIAWSQVTDLNMFYLIWIGLGVCAACTLYDPAFAVVATWFERRRSTALAIITFAGGLASTIFLPLSDALLHAYGWRQGVFILGLFLAVTTIPLHALALRRRPDDLGLLPDGDTKTSTETAPVARGISLSEALRSRFFWVMIAAFSLVSFAAAAVRVHFIPLLIDKGVDASTAAAASGSIGIMQVTGRLIIAPLSARFSGRVMVASVFALQAAAMFILLAGSSFLAVGVFIAVFGASYGAQTLARASIVAEIFGSTHYGRISSIMSMFLTVAGTAAPVGAALIYDHFHSFDPVILMALLLALAGTGVIAVARPDRKKHIVSREQQSDLL